MNGSENFSDSIPTDSVKVAHKKWVESCLKNGDNFRDDKWTRSIAVGRQSFVGNIKTLMGGLVKGRKGQKTGEAYQLREPQIPYSDHFRGKKSEIAIKNAYIWNVNC
jgi:hypothetical protein